MRSVTSILTCLFVAASALAQTPAVLRHVTRLMLDGKPLDGQHRVTVRWYDVPLGGTAALEESHDVVATLGLVDLRLGATSGLPDALIERGSVWLGYSVDGGPEDALREQLLSAPFARRAERAAVAERLAPQVSGIVTSINELAGAVRIVGDSSIDVRREGDALVLRQIGEGPSERGIIMGDGVAWRFTIRVATPLAAIAHVTLRVVSDTQTVIGATMVATDDATNSIIVATTAVLTTTERLLWSIEAK